jgi:hypothetical protein
VHLQNVPTILAVYPDARFSCTHRDPARILPSVSSLIANMRAAHSDEVDLPSIGRYHLDLYAATLDRYVDVVDGGIVDPDRLTNSRHVDFLDDAMGVTRGLYAHFGWKLSEDAEAAMEEHLRTHEEGRAGGRYDLAAFGLDIDQVNTRFERYAKRFGVAPAAR